MLFCLNRLYFLDVPVVMIKDVVMLQAIGGQPSGHEGQTNEEECLQVTL